MYRTVLTAPVFGLRREIDRLFEDTFGRDSAGGWVPAVDIHEDPQSLSFEVELPGISPDQVEVTADQGVLTIRGAKRGGNEERQASESARVHLIERSYGSFSRSFQLPVNVDEDRIEAQFENGVLTVRVPKAALPQPRKITIRNNRSVGTVNAGGAQRITGDGQRAGNGDGERTTNADASRTGGSESTSRTDSAANAGKEGTRRPAMAKAER